MTERLRLWLATAPAINRVTRRVMPHWYWTEEEIAELRRRLPSMREPWEQSYLVLWIN